jgi:PAS domain S-box-containing protein
VLTLSKYNGKTHLSIKERFCMATQQSISAPEAEAPAGLGEHRRLMLEFAMDRVREAAFLIGGDGSFLYVNGAACRSLGYSREELLGLSVHDADPNFARAPWEKYLALMEANGSCTFESLQKTKDGRVFPVEVDASYFVRDGERCIMTFVRDISERKRENLERELAGEQQAMLEFAMERISEAAYLVANDGRFVYVNGEACRSLGYSREELLGLSVPDINPDFPPIPWATYLRAHDHADLRTFEARNKTKDGRIFPVEVTACNFKRGDRTYRMALVRDISERKRAEEQRLMLEFALDHVQEGAFLIDFESGGRVKYVNGEACRSLGYSREELLGMSIPDFDLDVPEKRLRQDFPGLFQATFETRHKAKDGRTFPVEITGNPFEYQGKRYGLALVRNIALRKQAEEDCQRGEAQRLMLEFAMENVCEGAYLTDIGQGLRFIYVNAAACRSLGYSREELLGMCVSDIDPDHTRETLAKRFGGQPKPIVFDSHHRTKDGRVIPVEIKATFFQRDGKYYGMSLVSDITERKRVESERREAGERHAMLEFALDHVQEGAFLIDTENGARIVYANAEAACSLAYSREELLGLSVPDIDPDYSLEDFRKNFRTGRQPLVFESRHLTKDGSAFPVEVAWNSFEHAGRRLGVALVRDITERKLAEEEQRRAGERRAILELAMNNVGEAAYLLDHSARFLYVNEAACHMLGYGRHELLRMAVPDIDPEFSQEVWSRAFQEAAHSQTFETRHKCKDGRVFPAEIKWIRFEHHGQRYGLALASDISERKREEARRAEHLRFFECMDQVNRAIQGADDVERMMGSVLEAVLAVFGCDRTWLVHPLDPQASFLRVPMQRSRPEYGGAATMPSEISAGPETVEIFHKVLAARGPTAWGVSYGDTPAGIELQWELKSSIAMAIHPKSGGSWLFGMSQCSRERIWTPEEEQLFQEIGRRVCDALTMLLAHRTLRQEERKYHEIFDNVSDALALFDIESTGRVVLADLNPCAERMAGVPKEALIGTLYEKILSEEAAGNIHLARKAIETGEPLSFELDLELPGGARSLHTTLMPVRNERRQVHRLIVFNRDITQRKAHEKHLHLLMREIDHRAKNLLSVVQAVVRFTAGQADPKLFEQRLNERIAALASNHDLLVKNEWRGVKIRTLAEAQLAHFKDLLGTRVNLDGPDVLLKPAAAQAIGLALHELLTNAGKYGALSCAGGKVDVEWRIPLSAKGDFFEMRWCEQGGPEIVEPARRGFGHRVIVRMTEDALDGQVSLTHPATGLVWALTAPAASVLEGQP